MNVNCSLLLMTDVENDNIVQDFNVNDCDTCIDNTLEIFSDY